MRKFLNRKQLRVLERSGHVVAPAAVEEVGMMGQTQSPARSRWVLPVVLVGVVGLLAAIGMVVPKGQGGAADDGKLRIVCTFLPVYVFTQNVVGDIPDVDVQLLVDRDVGCPHSYSLTGRDLKLISRADLVVANGLGAEPFLSELLRSRRDLKIVTISDDCDLIGGETANAHAGCSHDHAAHEHKGCSHDHEGEQTKACPHDHGSDGHAGCTHDHHGGHENEKDARACCPHDHDSDVNPHTWVSPRQAARQVRTLAARLAEIDAGRADVYRANAEAYAQRLEALAQRMEEAAKSFANRNIVTGHAAFDYLARDLGLNIVATLREIPGETGSAAEMAKLIDTVRATKPAAIFWEPPFGDKLAETIARETGTAVYPLNPFNTDAGLPEATTPEQKRRLYEDVMNQNLATLQRALGATPSPQG